MGLQFKCGELDVKTVVIRTGKGVTIKNDLLFLHMAL